MQKIIDQIDASLEFVQRLYPASVIVCKVKKENKNYILKIARDYDLWDIAHLTQEKKRLILAQEVEGITHLIKEYPDIQNAKKILLKEYFEGKKISLFSKIQDTKLQIKLEHTVKDLHSLGIIDLDIAEKNIVISLDKKDIKIVDFANGKKEKKRSWIENKIAKYKDKKKLEGLFK